MTASCPICVRISALTPGDPRFIAERPSGYALLGDHQRYRGYTLFVGRRCVRELHGLPRDERTQFLADMADVAEAVYRAFQPRKLNYELLGNSVAHLHWHLFPRYDDDADPSWPVWNDPQLFAAPATDQELRELGGRVRAALAG